MATEKQREQAKRNSHDSLEGTQHRNETTVKGTNDKSVNNTWNAVSGSKKGLEKQNSRNEFAKRANAAKETHEKGDVPKKLSSQADYDKAYKAAIGKHIKEGKYNTNTERKVASSFAEKSADSKKLANSVANHSPELGKKSPALREKYAQSMVAAGYKDHLNNQPRPDQQRTKSALRDRKEPTPAEIKKANKISANAVKGTSPQSSDDDNSRKFSSPSQAEQMAAMQHYRKNSR